MQIHARNINPAAVRNEPRISRMTRIGEYEICGRNRVNSGRDGSPSRPTLRAERSGGGSLLSEIANFLPRMTRISFLSSVLSVKSVVHFLQQRPAFRSGALWQHIHSLLKLIPKGLHHLARGCEGRATLGCHSKKFTTLKGLHQFRINLIGFNPFRVVGFLFLPRVVRYAANPRLNDLIPLGLAAAFIVGTTLHAQDNPANQPSAPALSASAPTAASPSTNESTGNARQPNTNPTSAASSSGASGSPSGMSSALDYLYNRKPGEGTAAAQAAEMNAQANDRAKAANALGLGGGIGDAQTMARFEKYLGMSEVPESDLQAYAQGIDKVSALLKSNKTFEAWRALQALATYRSIDAGVSQELANRIESIWNTDKASSHIDNDIQKLREDIAKANNNADVMSDSLRKAEAVLQRQEATSQGRKSANNGGKNNGGVPQANQNGGDSNSTGTPTSMTSGLEGKMQLTEEYLTSLEAKARIKLNELKRQKLFDKAKADFADYIKALYTSGFHQHVILAADFYRKIFDEDEYPVEMANEVNASLEIARDVKSSIEVFRYKAGKNELAAATTRLEEAFALSELQPPLLELERPLKDEVSDYLTRLGRLQNLIEARDFGGLETLLDETRKIAVDFDATKSLALVNGVKLESKLHLGKAKLLTQQGDLKAAMDEFQEAAKAWPGNPALQDSSATFFDAQDAKSQAVTEFDRLSTEGNYRVIFEKQLVFATAVHGDAKREDQLKSALEKIKNAEIASEKANMMRNAGDVFGAWETIELAAKNLPNDNKLNALRADLSGKGAEFVAAISKAKDAEIRGELGFSLSWYAVAQRYYPASVMANEAIERLSKQLLAMEK